MNRLLLIDGHAILHRAYHAFPKNLTTRQGELVNAVYGFTRILLTVLRDLEPKYVAVAFDLPRPTFRHKEFIGYQIQRPQMDQELANQIDRVKEVVQVLNIPMFAVPGYEADDVIGTLARQASKKAETIIVTGDKDIMQLVDQKIKVFAPVRGTAEGEIFDRQKVKDLLGISPQQIIDYKALIGDPSDNYPGVPGIGPKTAVQLLSQYQTLKNIFKNLDKVKPIVAEKIKAGRESALLSQKLATIVTKVPIKIDFKACRVHDYDQEKALKLFGELEFKSLIGKLPGMKPTEKKEENEQTKLF